MRVAAVAATGLAPCAALLALCRAAAAAVLVRAVAPGLTCGDARGDLAANLADVALQAAHTRLARVAADNLAQGGGRETHLAAQ
jgi:hypothetical protein